MKALNFVNTGCEETFHRCVFAIQAEKEALTEAVGTDSLPRKEVIRFKVPQHLGFPGKALERIEEPKASHQPYNVVVNFFGLTGPSGVMPRHYSEWVIERCKHKDNAVKDFLDIFNHRLISLYHRAWEKYRQPLQYQYQLQTGRVDSISKVMQNLTGTNDDTLLHLGGLFSCSLRSAQGVKQIATVLSGCSVKVHEHVGKWLYLAHAEQTQLGGRYNPEGQHAQLGRTATLGSRVWDVGSAIEIELFAPDMDTVQKMMPGSPVTQLLEKTITEYLPGHINPVWSLTARYCDLPISRLGKHSMGLGRGCALSRNRGSMQDKTKIIIA